MVNGKSGNGGKPAVFLDRDGTLIHDVGTLRLPEHIALYADTIPALHVLQQQYDLFVITNQGGISQGLVRRDEVDTVNDALDRMLREQGVEIREWYVCPHTRDDHCACIKPNSFFMLKAGEKYGLDLSRSFVIGDHPHDALTGRKEGVFGLFILTGHGLRHLDEVPEDVPVFHRISDAVQWMLSHADPAAVIDREIREAARAIREGELAAFPTETVYGLGADALNPKAVAKIFTAKQRPLDDPLIVHVARPEDAELVAEEIPTAARRLMERFWPGPLTLVLPKRDAVPGIVTAGGTTVAVRMPANPIARQLIRESGRPIAAPSANLFGRTSPTTAAHVAEQLEGRYAVLIDGGACRVGVESTVVSVRKFHGRNSVRDGETGHGADQGAVAEILRPGGITAEDLEKVVGSVLFRHAGSGSSHGSESGRCLDSGSEETFQTASPGLLPAHYAPITPLVLDDHPERYLNEPGTAVILLAPTEYAGEPMVCREGDFTESRENLFILSRAGDVRGAAAMLYSTLRLVDSLSFRKIAAQRFPATGIGVALNDRLSRAAAGSLLEER